MPKVGYSSNLLNFFIFFLLDTLGGHPNSQKNRQLTSACIHVVELALEVQPGPPGKSLWAQHGHVDRQQTALKAQRTQLGAQLG